ncbi:unnamed protein product [Durusdinium trenchii]|uniref:Uncharacterized protein n=1 Tax=Durusdinium trenchii TaxID=1381693 RepID=A0ABP0I5I1_9DINO
MPPKIPKHPLQDVELNMNEVLTYSDLKLRWQWTTRFSTSRMRIARHWKPTRTEFPRNKPTCSFIWHDQMPHRTRLPELPEPETFKRIKEQELFCVFKSSVFHQHKVTVGDIVQAEKLHRRDAGEKVVFGTVLLVGSKESNWREKAANSRFRQFGRAMRLLVSITQTKNLTLGALVSDLKASKSFIPGHGLVQDKVALDVSGGNDTLCISIRNTQTQAYVCERKIPLSLLSTGIPWSSWVELLPPGDACATLDQVQPSPDQPQIFVTLEYGSSADIGKNGFEDLEALQHAFSKLERELELNKQQARERTSALAARPSLLDQEAAEIQAKEREMAAIRAKISAMSDAKRQASSAEEQLKEVMQEVAKMRDRWTQIETEVKDVNDRKLITETEISRLQRSMSEAKETLRLRTLSVAELRSNHDETERQLSQTLREREQWRESASKAQNDFDSEVKSASVELDHWRSEAQELATSIEELDEQKQALAQKASQEQGVQNDFMDALQKELEEAMSSFTSIEAQRSADGQHLAAAEERQRDAQERLQQAEQQAFELRSELREEGARAKSATEAVKKDLADKVSRVAQLEGSLSENRNQLKTIQQHVDGLMQDLMERTIKSSDDEAMLGTLARQLQQEQQDLEQIELEKEKLEKAVSQVLKHSEESRYQKQSLQDGYREEQGQLAQRSDMLSNTQTMAFTELERTSAQIAQLKEVETSFALVGQVALEIDHASLPRL